MNVHIHTFLVSSFCILLYFHESVRYQNEILSQNVTVLFHV